MELTALASVAITSSSYFEKVDEYNAFENNKSAVGGNWSTDEGKQYFDAKNNAIPPLIGSCVSAGIIWVWNVWDVKKTSSSKYSDIHPVSIGINSRCQIEARISF
jgi:predicted NAD/FAD-dependent oxidoreductase